MSDSPAARVERGDPDRFLATMATPPALREDLFVLYAVNLELARAAWVTKEPLIARMRLQFWADVVDSSSAPPAHDLAVPLARVIRSHGLPPGLFHRMIEARAQDTERAPFDDEAALWAYLSDTSGALLALAARVCGARDDQAALAIGTAQGVANYFLAVPALVAAGRLPLPDGRPESVAALARAGLARLDDGRRLARGLPAAARPALLAAWRTRALLTQAARDPGRVDAGALGQSEFVRRGSLLWTTLTGL